MAAVTGFFCMLGLTVQLVGDSQQVGGSRTNPAAIVLIAERRLSGVEDPGLYCKYLCCQ